MKQRGAERKQRGVGLWITKDKETRLKGGPNCQIWDNLSTKIVKYSNEYKSYL